MTIGRRKVLFLCTEEESAGAMRFWLEKAGFEAIEPGSVQEVMTLLQAGEVAALVLDRFLPPWPGLPTIMQLKRAYSGLKVILVGDPSSADMILARTFGADRTIPRPLRRNAVLAAVMAGAQ